MLIRPFVLGECSCRILPNSELGMYTNIVSSEVVIESNLELRKSYRVGTLYFLYQYVRVMRCGQVGVENKDCFQVNTCRLTLRHDNLGVAISR